MGDGTMASPHDGTMRSFDERRTTDNESKRVRVLHLNWCIQKVVRYG